MLTDAGFTAERYPGIRIDGLQTMDEAEPGGQDKDPSRWLERRRHPRERRSFDPSVFYLADVEAPKDVGYLEPARVQRQALLLREAPDEDS